MKEILSENSNQVLKNEVQKRLRTILKVDFRIAESEDNLKRGLQSLFLSKTGNLISRHSLMKTLDQFVDECIRIELNKEKPDRENIRNLLLRKRLLNDKIMAYSIKKRKNVSVPFSRRAGLYR